MSNYREGSTANLHQMEVVNGNHLLVGGLDEQGLSIDADDYDDDSFGVPAIRKFSQVNIDDMQPIDQH